MDIIVYQNVQLKGIAHSIRSPKKTFTSDVIPHKGDFFEDSAFKDPYEYEIQSVTINYQRDCCTIYLEPFEIESTDQSLVTQQIEVYKLHGWKCDFI